MARFFFGLADGTHSPDLEGTELQDITAARLEAVRFASEVLRERPELPWFGHDFRVEVTDADKNLLFTVIILAIDAPRGRSADH